MLPHPPYKTAFIRWNILLIAAGANLKPLHALGIDRRPFSAPSFQSSPHIKFRECHGGVNDGGQRADTCNNNQVTEIDPIHQDTAAGGH